MSNTIIRGAVAEKKAENYLKRHGLTVLHRNYRRRFGEIDLIMRDEECLVFVEVRSRSSSSLCRAEETVDEMKQAKLMKTALSYLQQSSVDSPCRFDVIAINGEDITWIKDAF